MLCNHHNKVQLNLLRSKSRRRKEISGSNNLIQSLSNAAVQEASGGSKNVNQVIRQAAQILANREGIPVEKVEAVIIQIALQIAQERAISGQYIFQLANQIVQNPNSVLAQAILKLVNQDDGGKSSHTTTIIKNYVKVSSSRSGDGGSRPPSEDPCKKDPTSKDCKPSEIIPKQSLAKDEKTPLDTDGDDGVAALDTGDTDTYDTDTGDSGDGGDSSDSSDSDSGDSSDSSDSSDGGGGDGGDSGDSGDGGGGDTSE
jgi:uncharacterized membrane protein YgcG